MRVVQSNLFKEGKATMALGKIYFKNKHTKKTVEYSLKDNVRQLVLMDFEEKKNPANTIKDGLFTLGAVTAVASASIIGGLAALWLSDKLSLSDKSEYALGIEFYDGAWAALVVNHHCYKILEKYLTNPA